MTILILVIVGDLASSESSIVSFCKRIVSLPIPKPALWFTLFFLLTSLYHCLTHSIAFPFHSIDMFSAVAGNVNRPKVFHRAKYFYFNENGEPKIVDIRAQHFPGLSGLLDWRAGNDYTFVAAFDYESRNKNHDYLLSLLKEKGIGRLHVGVQTVNYGSGEVRFFTSVEEAQAVFPHIKTETVKLYVPPPPDSEGQEK